MKSGKFIVVEGLEGAGKSSVIAQINTALKDAQKDVVNTREPGGTPLAEQIRELLIVDDRFPNHQSGRVWLWQTEIQMQVRQKNLAYAQRVLEERSAEIKTGVAQIVRTSHHKHLTEPNLDTLNRQIEEYLRDVFEYDASGESRVERVLIPKCTGVPADF